MKDSSSLLVPHLTPSSQRPLTYNVLRTYLSYFHSVIEPLPVELTELLQWRPNLKVTQEPNRIDIQTAINESIRGCLELLEEHNEEYARVLFRRFIIKQGESIRELVVKNIGIDDRNDRRFKAEEARLNQVQRRAIEELVGIILEQEVRARPTIQKRMRHTLGVPNYQELIGTEILEQTLFEELISPDGNDILVLTGHGGIGKTSLADRLVRKAIDQMVIFDVVRVDIKSGVISDDLFCKLLFHKLYRQPFEGAEIGSTAEAPLIQTLKSFPYLVLVDGLEDQVDPVLEKIRLFCGPTKFIVTSRMMPAERNQVTCHSVPSLQPEDGLCLFATTLQRVHNANEPIPFNVEQFEPVFEKVGGNPLAIKLVATLTQQMSLPEVLSDLETVDHEQTHMLYDRVYSRVWGLLDEIGQQVMISLALFEKNQVSQKMILDMNGADQPGLGLQPITAQQLRATLDLLIRQSLIELSGSFLDDSYYYRLHNLTLTFLRTSIIQWPVGFEVAKRYGHVTPLPQIQQGITHWLSKAEQLDDEARPEKEIIHDLNSISEIIDWGLYWDDTRRDAVELLHAIWLHLQRHGHFNAFEALLKKAAHHLNQAETDPAISIQLENRLGEIYRLNGKLSLAISTHQAMLARAEKLKNSELSAQTKGLLAEDLLTQNELEMAEQLAREAFDWFSENRPTSSWAVAVTNCLGRISLMQDDFAPALTYFEPLLAHAPKSMHQTDKGRLLRNIGLAALGTKDFSKAEDAFVQALDYAKGRDLELARAYIDLSSLYIELNEFEKALPVLEAAEDLIPHNRDQLNLLGFLKHRLGYVHLRRGDWGKAEEQMVRAILLRERVGWDWALAESYGVLGEVYLRSRQFKQAIEFYEKALELKEFFPPHSSFESDVLSELKEAKEGLGLGK